MALLVGDVIWDGEGTDPVPEIAARLRVPRSAIHSFRLVKKSLDGRHKRPVWRATWRVEVDGEAKVLAKRPHSTRAWTARDEERYGAEDGAPAVRPLWPADVRPIVVGAGPAGLFAALALAEAGAPVRLFDRGGPVEERVAATNRHWQRKIPLDPENNLLFGEGGAGTFSDGKIYTRRRDGELGHLFRRLVDFGADPAIMNESYAHLGTDKVRAILPVFRKRLVELGVDVRYHARVDDLVVEGGRCVGVVLADGTVERGGPVLIGAGHSARNTAEMLLKAGASAVARDIAIGARIEHPQGLIDQASYGQERGELPAASYRLADNQAGERQAYTFCMCPGGMVVPAADRGDRVVVNGMSFAARRAFWANSAVIVGVRTSDYGADDPLAGYRWQDRIEEAAFRAGGGDGKAPAQRFVDLRAGRASVDLPKTSFPLGVTPADLRTVLPEFVIRGMIRAIESFDRKLPGFAGDDAVLIAPETRTTSPVRFLRDEQGESVGLPGLYPIGEGAGYGGGIISCALDGHRIARNIVVRASG